MLTKLVQLETVGSVLGVLGSGVVAIMAATALQGHEWTVALWHYFAPFFGVMAAATAYKSMPGNTPVMIIIVRTIRRTTVGSTFRYSAIPPQSPRTFL